ncbi:hypothetical protein HNQ81_001353 [Desulfoprunum benzoelyticum]|uniref:Uncharacterized protein n=1 Tax=Desulfoprunum benzoelyticum TaxID=1506996 RepID=A0A840UPD6_9BACT|nr:hypothetical protein [Desulfoprunum benzoelyticum]MBB5347632.1 hypothetical protein [Desulfoprunum benzoelyticum]
MADEKSAASAAEMSSTTPPAEVMTFESTGQGMLIVSIIVG